MSDYLIERLRAQHATLEEELRLEHRRAVPDAARITILKREKLRIRDRLQALEGVAA